jgi:hypothetical protein
MIYRFSPLFTLSYDLLLYTNAAAHKGTFVHSSKDPQVYISFVFPSNYLNFVSALPRVVNCALDRQVIRLLIARLHTSPYLEHMLLCGARPLNRRNILFCLSFNFIPHAINAAFILSFFLFCLRLIWVMISLDRLLFLGRSIFYY